MLTIDVTSGSSGNRWNINSFLNSGKRKDIIINNKEIPKEDIQQLDQVIRLIDAEFNKITSELSRQEKSLTVIESQLNKRIDKFSDLGEPGEIEIQYRKMALDIISAKTKISMEKAKLYESKIKQMREERKAIYDKNKGNAPVVSETSTENLANPIGVANGIQNTGFNTIGVNIPQYVVSNLKTMKPAETPQANTTQEPVGASKPQVTQEVKGDGSSPATFQVAEEGRATPVVEVANKDEVINPNSVNIATENTITVQDQYQKNLELIKIRERNKETLLRNQEGVLGAKMIRSLDSLVSNVEKPEERLFVDKDSGKFWIEGFVKDENGNRVKSDSYIHKSVMHIGKVRFDVKNHLAKTSHYDESIPFEIVDESSMPEFYVKEWNKESSQRYLLDEGILELLV